tara:strand:- start:77 stop:520 length:444 start_codon:yes stop_codon:yes gene_type:complete
MSKKISNTGKVAIVVGILLLGTLGYFLFRKKDDKEQEIVREAVDNLLFKMNKSEINESSFESLNKVAELLKSNEKSLELIGHTDSVGSSTYNQTLSQNRASAVKDYLVSQGVTSEIVAMGKGEESPIADNNTSEGKALNRRVEFILT